MTAAVPEKGKFAVKRAVKLEPFDEKVDKKPKLQASRSTRQGRSSKGGGKKFVPEAVVGERWNKELNRIDVEVKWEGYDETEFSHKDFFISEIGYDAFLALC